MKRPWPALFLVGLAVRSDAFGGTKRSRTIARSWSGTDAPLKSAVFDRGWDENHERSSEVEVVDGCPLTADEEFIRLRNEIRNPTNSELNKKYASIIPLTVHILRREYGTRPTWWGDLTASEARLLYWRLLPTVMLLEEEFICLPLKDRAYIASMARYAAKLYARERSMVPERAAAAVYDGTRYALKTGRWSPTGMSVEEIWLKYEREVKEELSADAVTEDELYRRLYQRILRKSCSTNPFIDAVCSTNPSAVSRLVFLAKVGLWAPLRSATARLCLVWGLLGCALGAIAHRFVYRFVALFPDGP